MHIRGLLWIQIIHLVRHILKVLSEIVSLNNYHVTGGLRAVPYTVPYTKKAPIKKLHAPLG